MAKQDCPCGTGLRSSACCAPLHRGDQSAADAVQLMRSRFAAFALGEPGYLWRTLASLHTDRARPESDVMRELRENIRRFKYQRLVILDSRPPSPAGVAQVLFLAGVFQAGKDHSFVERSDFVFERDGWKYLSGISRTVSELTSDPLKLTLATFD